MSSLLPFPADLPWWATLAILVPVAIYALLLLAMPFSVFGLKSRLDQIEGQLEGIAEELRGISARLPNRAAAPAVAVPASPVYREPALAAAPLPSAAEMAASMRPLRAESDPEPAPRARAEPRLDWRR